MSQITSTDTLANVQSGESLPLPDMGVHEMPIKPAKDQLPAQYSYDSFDQVLKWITHFSDIFGHHTAHIFDGHLALRYYYLSEGDVGGVKSAENLIKNHVGIFRFEEETENFRERFAGKSARFLQGKFISWQGEVPYDPSLRGVYWI